jgi:hypothetical protein
MRSHLFRCDGCTATAESVDGGWPPPPWILVTVGYEGRGLPHKTVKQFDACSPKCGQALAAAALADDDVAASRVAHAKRACEGAKRSGVSCGGLASEERKL